MSEFALVTSGSRDVNDLDLSPVHVDNPQTPEFASWRSYEEFARRVRRTHRYVWGSEVQAFLDTVLATLRGRDRHIAQGRIFYRAQRGIDSELRCDEHGNEIGEETLGFGPSRMKPLANRAMEGRINPAGIPMLYLASTEQTAVCEVRPWIGSDVSVAQFKIMRELRAVDLTPGHGRSSIMELPFDSLTGDKPLSAEQKEGAVWIDIDSAFSRPITLSDDAADYVPTQILAELFRSVGYDAVIYRSQFGVDGFSIAIFNVDDGEIINCAPYQVTGIEVKYEQIGNRWFSQKHLDAKN